MGTPSAVKAEEGSAKVTLEGCGEKSGPTTIHIHINQESCLTSLWKAVQHIRRPSLTTRKGAGSTQSPLTPKDGPGARAGSGGEQKALGGVQILLGIFCVVLGVEILRGFHQLDFYEWYIPYYIFKYHCAFWMGSVFIVTGIFSVVGARRGGFWVPVATFFNLASVVTGIVGFVLTTIEVSFFQDSSWLASYVCPNEPNRSQGWQVVTGSYTPRDDSRWLERCNVFVEYFRMLNIEVRIILLVFAGVVVAISLFGLGYGFRLLCCRFWAKVDYYNTLPEEETPLPYGNEEDPERGMDAA